MARESTIQILYGGTTTGAPGDLSNGELAYAHGSKNLFVGAGGNNTAVWVGAEILDENDFNSNSATSLATQQSIKAYVDNQIGASAGVTSIETITGAVNVASENGVTHRISGSDLIFAGVTASTSQNGVASFYDAQFTVTSTGQVRIGTNAVGAAQLANNSVDTDAIVNANVTNAKLANDSVTINAGVGLSGGGSVALGSSVSLDLAIPNSSITNDQLVNDSIVITAGDGLAGTASTIALGNSTSLSVNVDDSTIEISADALRIKDSGVTNAKLANSSFTLSDGGSPIESTQLISLGDTLTVKGTANEVSVVHSTDTITVGLPDDVTIGGDLTVTGDLTVQGDIVTMNVSTIDVEDTLIKLGINNSSDVIDIGFVGQYNDGENKYSGLVRNASVTDANGNAEYFLFTESTTDPTTNTISDSSTIATLRANIVAGTYT